MTNADKFQARTVSGRRFFVFVPDEQRQSMRTNDIASLARANATNFVASERAAQWRHDSLRHLGRVNMENDRA